MADHFINRNTDTLRIAFIIQAGRNATILDDKLVRRSIDCRSETATLASCPPRGLRHAPIARRKHVHFRG